MWGVKHDSERVGGVKSTNMSIRSGVGLSSAENLETVVQQPLSPLRASEVLHVERRNGRLFPRVDLAPGPGKVVGWELSPSERCFRLSRLHPWKGWAGTGWRQVEIGVFWFWPRGAFRVVTLVSALLRAAK